MAISVCLLYRDLNLCLSGSNIQAILSVFSQFFLSSLSATYQLSFMLIIHRIDGA